MMRVRFDNQIFLTQEYGGISRYFVELASALTERGDCSIEVGGWMSVNRYLQCSPKVRTKGISGRFWHRGDRFRQMAGRWLDDVSTRVSSAEILHCTYFRLPPPTRARVVATVYDCIPELFPDRGQDQTIAKKQSMAMRADLVVCISQTTANDLVRLHGIAKEKIRVIPLACALPESDRSSRPHDRPYMLFVGQRASYKNYDMLRQAYERSPALYQNFDLVCFGGPPLAQSEIPAFGRVRHVSGSDTELACFYRHAVALVYPSLYEGFGIPPLEAWQSDCPVIHCGGGAVAEVVADAGILLNGHDQDTFMEGLVRAFSDQEGRALAVERGRSRRTLYSWSACAAAHADAYASLL